MFQYRHVRSLDFVVASAYAFLVENGWRAQAKALCEEFLLLDEVCLLAELRALMLRKGCSLDVVARFDR